MKNLIIILLLICLLDTNLAQSKQIEITGKTMVGKKINGQKIREVIDNVIIKQGETTITCDKAIQYLDINEIELFGNVVIVRDSISIITEKGRYNGDKEFAYSNTGLILNDGKVLLSAKVGYYYLDLDRAEFYKDVSLFDKNSKLFSQKLVYHQKDNLSIATGEVKLSDTSTVVFADSLINDKNLNKTLAFNNVRVFNKDNELNVYGQFLEHNDSLSYSKIWGDPILMQIDTTESGNIDTLLMKAISMEVFSDTTLNYLVATDSVEMVRGDFTAKNDLSVFYRNENRIFTYKLDKDNSRQPVMWFEENQLLGDSVNVIMSDNSIKMIDIKHNSLILSTDETHQFRFNQISGDSVKIYFSDNKIRMTEVFGHVLSIYYMSDDEESNGLIKSSAERAKIIFKDNSIEEVKFYQSVENEFHPEKLILGKERDFTLPSFIIFNDRPIRNKFLKRFNLE